MSKRHHPAEVLPRAVARAVFDTSYWFLIGGQAVRCFCPYWATVKDFFRTAVAALIVPPRVPLSIQRQRVDISTNDKKRPRR